MPAPAPTAPTSAVNPGLRPAMVECNGCTNFLIDGLKTVNSVYWTLHPLYSTNVVIQNSTVDSTGGSGANGDGIDPDSSKDVLVQNDTFATSDDIIALKSGLNEVGIAVGKPDEEIVIRNVTAATGHSLSVGSEMSGGIENVLVTAGAGMVNALSSMQYLFHIKTLPGRGGTIHNIWDEDVTGTCSKKYCLEVTANYGSSTIAPHDTSLVPVVKDVTFQNIMGDGKGACVEGASNVTFSTSNISVTATSGCP
jgi:polygalacturonase